MQRHWLFYACTLLALAIIISCFLPWVSFKNNAVVFTGVKTETFANGVNYGKPGYFIIPLAVLAAASILAARRVTKRIALFLGGLMVAYSFRTFNLFTSSLFEGEVIPHAGIYLILVLPMLLFLATIFLPVPLSQNAEQ